jgi:uncharacterized protein
LVEKSSEPSIVEQQPIATGARCAIPTLEHRGLPENLEVLRLLVKRNRLEVRGVGVRPCAGVYAQPISSGGIEPGAPVAFVD